MMRYLILSAAALATATGGAARLPRADYPSCNVTQQRALTASTGGAVRDPRQAHISMRVNVLEADLGNARVARLVSAAEVTRLGRRLAALKRQANAFVARQGFLSAGETASYDRELDAIAMRLCG